MSNDSPSETLLTMAGLLRPSAVRAAATLGIADLVASGVTHVSEMAARTGADAEVLDMLLRYLVELEILRRAEGDGYQLTELGEPLRTEHAQSVRTQLRTDSLFGRADVALVDVLHTVRTGEPSHPAVFGQGYWESVNLDPEFGDAFETFDARSEIPLVMGAELVVEGYDWSSVDRLVDVGGHSGAILIELLRRNPRLHGSLVDLDNVAETARRNFAATGVADRAEAVIGSFFDRLPTGGDVYLLSAILADWPDKEAVEILRRCAQAAAPDGRVLLAEVSLPTTVAELQLWIRATMPAPTRSAAELKALGADAGLRVSWEGPATPVRSLIEFVPDDAPKTTKPH